MSNLRVIVVYSGGLDSTVLLTEAKKSYKDVTALNFHYGSKHNDMERNAAELITSMLKVQLVSINLDFIRDLFKSDLLRSGGDIPEGHYAADSMKSTVVPFRNGIMLSIAAGYAESIGASRVMLASHAGDHTVYPDCRPEFNRAMDAAIIKGTNRVVNLVTPFQEKTKADIVRRGIEFKAPLKWTYSCYKGGLRHCGCCGTCTERIEAFQLVGYVDPVVYEIEIDWRDCRPYDHTV